MNSKVLITFAFLVSILFLSSIQLSDSYAPRLWRSFRIETPTEFTASPGEEITINGSIYNTGLWWLHDFNLTLSGMDYEYTVFPDHFDNLRILRGWDSDTGVYIMPENFTVKIKVPETASGVSFVIIKGQEFQSWKMVSNTTTFVLKITPQPTKFSIADMVIPENVSESQPFNISFTVKNEGSTKGTVTVSTNVPEDWTITEANKTIEIEANSSKEVVLTITPTNSSGIISISAEYPYKQDIIHISKVGPLLIPIPKETTTSTIVQPLLPSKIVLPIVGTIPINRITILLAIAVIVVLIILWKILSMYQFKIKRGQPEEMKKQAETKQVESNSDAESFANSTTQI